jgi:hypothetical protein
MATRGVHVRDAQWAKIEPHLPRLPHTRRAGPWVSHRAVTDGILPRRGFADDHFVRRLAGPYRGATRCRRPTAARPWRHRLSSRGRVAPGISVSCSRPISIRGAAAAGPDCWRARRPALSTRARYRTASSSPFSVGLSRPHGSRCDSPALATRTTTRQGLAHSDQS